MAEPFTDEEIANFQQLVDQTKKDMPPMLLLKPGFIEAHENYRRFLDTITADRKRFGETIDGYTKDWADQKRKFQKRIGTLLLVEADLSKHIADQTAEIERLRGDIERIITTIGARDDHLSCFAAVLFIARQALDAGKE